MHVHELEFIDIFKWLLGNAYFGGGGGAKKHKIFVRI